MWFNGIAVVSALDQQIAGSTPGRRAFQQWSWAGLGWAGQAAHTDVGLHLLPSSVLFGTGIRLEGSRSGVAPAMWHFHYTD